MFCIPIYLVYIIPLLVIPMKPNIVVYQCFEVKGNTDHGMGNHRRNDQISVITVDSRGKMEEVNRETGSHGRLERKSRSSQPR